jgi:hypothetical protein
MDLMMKQLSKKPSMIAKHTRPTKQEKQMRNTAVICSLLLGCCIPYVGFGQGNDTSIESQLAKLKAEVALLKAERDTNEKNSQNKQNKKSSDAEKGGYHTSVVSEDIDQDAEDDSIITFPTNRGQIQNFLFSNLHEGSLPFGKMNSSQFGLNILQHRNKYSDKALVFGGYLEADGSVWNGSTIVRANQTGKSETGVNTYQSGKGMYLTTAALYTAANLGRYVTAEMTLLGNEKNTPVISDAFVMFGNLDDYPVYATVGKNRLPIGSFAGGGVWTGSLVQMLFRPNRVTNASVAYFDHGLSANVTLFQTDDHTSDFSSALFYGKQVEQWLFGVNVGYVHDVNGTGNPSFNAATRSGTADKTRIGAINTGATVTYDIYGIGAGWAQTTHTSTVTNNNYAGAWYVRGGLAPELYGRSTNFSLSYHGAYNTNDIPITLSGSPINGYSTQGSNSSGGVKVSGSGVNRMIIAAAQRPFFTENVLIGLEYAYMHMYNHQHSNAWTLDLSVYF